MQCKECPIRTWNDLANPLFDHEGKPKLDSEDIIKNIKSAIEQLEWDLESCYEARGTDDFSEADTALYQTMIDRLNELLEPRIKL